MIPYLAAALRAAAPRADAAIWLPELQAVLPAGGIDTPRRVAAILGQCAIEAGEDLETLTENLDYRTPRVLKETFPSRFRSEAEARPYLGAPRKLANHVYAFRNGNGPEETDDGWTFRGSGLLQLTGRENIGRFALASGKSISAEQAADWLRTPPGAVAGAVWYWNTHSLSDLADTWSIDAITLKVNGKAMMHAAERRQACQRALDAIFAASDTTGPAIPTGLPPTVAPPVVKDSLHTAPPTPDHEARG